MSVAEWGGSWRESELWGWWALYQWKWQKRWWSRRLCVRFTVEAGPGGGTVRMEAKTEIKEGEEITVWSPLSLLSFSSLIYITIMSTRNELNTVIVILVSSRKLSLNINTSWIHTFSGSVLQLRLGNSQKAAPVESRMVLLVFGPSCTKIYL